MLYFDQYLSRHNYKSSILVPPLDGTSIIVVIPCFNEPDVLFSLESLYNCDREGISVEVIVVINYGEHCSQEDKEYNKSTFENIQSWAVERNTPGFLCYSVFAPDLPSKFAGVGLARKIGMDEAAARFNIIGKENGIICGFDADAKVASNYLKSISEHFLRNPKTPGTSIYFEHPFEQIEDKRMRSGIIQYETHLRYLIQAIRFTGFPLAFHTVGSSFAVRAAAYVKQGGMNKFKAGEDFYFLNKIIALGGFTEVNETIVLPQARVSNRVPFGTGASMAKWMDAEQEDFLTYQFASFLPLKRLFENIGIIYQQKAIPDEVLTNSVLRQFLNENEMEKAIKEIYDNSSSFQSFQKRFFTWFDAFRIVKYLNFSAQVDFPKNPVKPECEKLLNALGKDLIFKSNEEMLLTYRKWDRFGLENV